MNTREVGLLLMVVFLVLLWGSTNPSKRWRRSGVIGYLDASYAASYTGLAAMLASMWLGDNGHWWDRWFAITRRRDFNDA
jgi:hypothetical protein